MIEDELIHTLRARAGAAPTPPADLLDRVSSGYRRRRNGRLAAAAAAVVLVVAVTTLGLQQPDRAVKTEVTSSAPAAPIEKVWPHALHLVPKRLENGRKVGLIGFLSDFELLVGTFKEDVADALYSYDLHSKKFRRFSGYSEPPRTVEQTEGFVVGEGRVAWQQETAKTTELWVAPFTGAPPVKLADGPAFAQDRKDVYGLSIADTTLYWSVTGEAGVHQVPLTGGPVTRVPGTKDATIHTWPWVGGPRFVDDMSGGGPDQIAFREIRNLETGERRSARLPDKGQWFCSLTWCHGDGVARTRDGSRSMKLPPGSAGASWHGPVLDRFVQVDQPVTGPGAMGEARPAEGDGLSILIDLKTGKAGTMPPFWDPKEKALSGQVQLSDRLHFYETADGYMVVDLAAIG